jgi:hypothetical protein
MAVQDAVLVPSQEAVLKLTALGAAASSTEQLLGKNQLFAINATDDCHIAFGVTSMGVASATDFRLPQDAVVVYDTGQAFTHIRVFNNTGAAIDVYIQPLSRF